MSSSHCAPRPARRRDGRALLQLHIAEKFDGVEARFARAAGLDPSHISRILDGHRGGALTVDTAAAIHGATRGAVPWYAWTSSGQPPANDDATAPDPAADAAPGGEGGAA